MDRLYRKGKAETHITDFQSNYSHRINLDNCCYNRPFDDQAQEIMSQLKIRAFDRLHIAVAQ